MKTDYAPLDIASYLDNEEVIAEYLTAAAEDEDQNVLLAALAYVAKARGMARVAEAAGLGRESLYKTLAPDRTHDSKPSEPYCALSMLRSPCARR